ncbi:hypothetical protein C8J56DRAFT_536628 [Mycena floridula]|nr:hypothetical protein C8J56DRAFT_536628 [Mycena floridula]
MKSLQFNYHHGPNQRLSALLLAVVALNAASTFGALTPDSTFLVARAGKPKVAPKKPSSIPVPHSSKTDKIGVAADGAGVIVDAINAVRPKTHTSARMKPAPKQEPASRSSTTDKIGVAVNGAGVIVDAVNTGATLGPYRSPQEAMSTEAGACSQVFDD